MVMERKQFNRLLQAIHHKQNFDSVLAPLQDPRFQFDSTTGKLSPEGEAIAQVSLRAGEFFKELDQEVILELWRVFQHIQTRAELYKRVEKSDDEPLKQSWKFINAFYFSVWELDQYKHSMPLETFLELCTQKGVTLPDDFIDPDTKEIADTWKRSWSESQCLALVKVNELEPLFLTFVQFLYKKSLLQS
jgi:hypothetical protein